jgi:methionine-rich copper-binding protein CopC
MRRLLAAAVVAGALVVASAPGGAHSELIASEPLPGQAVGEVDEIRLIFAGDFDLDEDVVVTLERRSDGEPIELGAPVTPTASSIEVDVIGDLPGGGDYVVRYETTAADEGLRQQGGFAFTYDPSLAPGGVDPIAVGALVVGGLALVALVVMVARGRSDEDDGVADDAVEFDPDAVDEGIELGDDVDLDDLDLDDLDLDEGSPSGTTGP